MSTPLTPNVGPSPVRSKIIFPAQPPLVPLASCSSSAGGALPATNYLIKVTWVIQTQDGTQWESLPSEETSFAVAASNLLNVASPPNTVMPYALIGWNVYVGTTSGEEALQNSSPIAIGTPWIEPTSGLLVSLPPPTTWGNELIFTFPARNFPAFNPEWHGHDDFSTAGWQQSITWYVDKILDFSMPYIQAGNDAAAWQQFLGLAILRVPFDFYQDSTSAQFVTLLLQTPNPKLEYKSAGFYAINALKCRQVILSQ
jgi:hypothetical protein